MMLGGRESLDGDKVTWFGVIAEKNSSTPLLIYQRVVQSCEDVGRRHGSGQAHSQHVIDHICRGFCLFEIIFLMYIYMPDTDCYMVCLELSMFLASTIACYLR